MISKITLYLSFLLFVQFSLYGQEKPVVIKDSAYFDSTLRLFARCNNTHRYRFVKKYAQRDSLQNLIVKTEAIDWFGIYRNVIIEKKGECDSIVYVVCHYDKIDGNIITVFNLLVNGNLDILLSNIYLSKGAYDNGTGVATLLSLLSWINSQGTHYTYRFLFTGMEEFGLRGSRRHISGVKKDKWSKCFYAINIDMVGKKGIKGITITQNVSDTNLVKIAEELCNDNKFILLKSKMPVGAYSDYYFFKGQNFGKDFGFSFLVNLTGAFIPQRSYFTRNKKGIPVINFTDEVKVSVSELLSLFSPVAFGEVHSIRDRNKVVDANNLVDYHNFIKKFIMFIDNQKSLELGKT